MRAIPIEGEVPLIASAAASTTALPVLSRLISEESEEDNNPALKHPCCFRKEQEFVGALGSFSSFCPVEMDSGWWNGGERPPLVAAVPGSHLATRQSKWLGREGDVQ